MKSWIQIKKEFTPEQNFWELNPQLSYISPFSKLYELKDSSKYMWAIFFLEDNDESKNLLFRYPPKERMDAIQNYFPDIDFENEIFIEARNAYSRKCLSSIQRALKAEQEAIDKRIKAIQNTPYTFDHYRIDEDTGDYVYDKSDKPILIKGTSKQLDDAYKNTDTIYERFEKALARFEDEKSEEARVYGGRKKTFSEKGLV